MKLPRLRPIAARCNSRSPATAAAVCPTTVPSPFCRAKPVLACSLRRLLLPHRRPCFATPAPFSATMAIQSSPASVLLCRKPSLAGISTATVVPPLLLQSRRCSCPVSGAEIPEPFQIRAAQIQDAGADLVSAGLSLFNPTPSPITVVAQSFPFVAAFRRWALSLCALFWKE